MSDVHPQDLREMFWILETNGSSREIGGGADMVLQSPDGVSIARQSSAHSLPPIMKPNTLLRLRLAKELSVTNLEL